MTARLLRRASAVLALTTVTTLAAIPSMADPTVENGTAQVDVDQEGNAQVDASYLIAASPDAPAETLSLSGLAFGSASIEDVDISTADGQRLEPAIETVDLKTTATVDLPALLEPGSELELRVKYTVSGAAEFDGDRIEVHTPVLTPDVLTSSTTPGLFTAAVSLPPGYEYIEGFPANPERVDSTGDGATVHYEVPSATALLRVVGTSGSGPLLTLEGGVNLMLVIVLLLGSGVLYLSFTRGRKRAAELAADTPAPVSAGGTADPERRL